MPFASAHLRAIHFAKHRYAVGAKDEFEYERMADAFMSGPMHPNLFECTNPTGTRDRVRLDAGTRFLGIAYGVLTIRTLHTRSVTQIAAQGGPAGFVAHKCAEVH